MNNWPAYVKCVQYYSAGWLHEPLDCITSQFTSRICLCVNVLTCVCMRAPQLNRSCITHRAVTLQGELCSTTARRVLLGVRWCKAVARLPQCSVPEGRARARCQPSEPPRKPHAALMTRDTLPRAPTHTPVTHVSSDWHLPPSSGAQTYQNSAKLARADFNNSLFKTELVCLCGSVQVCVCVCVLPPVSPHWYHSYIICHSYCMIDTLTVYTVYLYS